jgi:hypothetical protein
MGVALSNMVTRRRSLIKLPATVNAVALTKMLTLMTQPAATLSSATAASRPVAQSAVESIMDFNMLDAT